jgi:UDP-glucose 4-epimerase
VDAVTAVSRLPVPVEYGPRRPGDPAALVADATRARGALGWRPEYADLREIVETAWRWHSSRPLSLRRVGHA